MTKTEVQSLTLAQLHVIYTEGNAELRVLARDELDRRRYEFPPQRRFELPARGVLAKRAAAAGRVDWRARAWDR